MSDFAVGLACAAVAVLGERELVDARSAAQPTASLSAHTHTISAACRINTSASPRPHLTPYSVW